MELLGVILVFAVLLLYIIIIIAVIAASIAIGLVYSVFNSIYSAIKFNLLSVKSNITNKFIRYSLYFVVVALILGSLLALYFVIFGGGF